MSRDHHTKLPQITAVVGPTASGKTALGIALALRTSGSVVSADSRQVYVGMDIGTAKPPATFTSAGAAAHNTLTPDLVDSVPHYLLNVARPDEPWSLAQWQAAAFEVIDHLIKEGRSPLLVGGTMLYVDSILFNYAVPEVPADPSLRARLEQKSAETLYAELLEKDPAAADFIEPGNTRRIIRALEVISATGQPFSKMRQQQPPRYNVRMVGIFPGWERLEQNIRERAEMMLREGLLDETKKLIEKYSEELPLLQTMNYKQALAVIRDEITEDEAVQEMVRVNLRYARRQMSWWRGRTEIEWFESVDEAVEHME